MTANRVRRLPSLPGACSTARRKISITQADDLPEPTGPMQQRMKAFERPNSESVGGAVYVTETSGICKKLSAQLLNRLIESLTEQLLEHRGRLVHQRLAPGHGDIRGIALLAVLHHEPPRLHVLCRLRHASRVVLN